jgi:hypothetical protein
MASKSSTIEPEKALQTIDHERVAELAHRIYLARGAGDGHDVDDWLEAETHLQQQVRSQDKRALL